LGELRSTIARRNRGEKIPGLRYRETRYYESMLYRMFAIPMAPLLFSLIGVPLAILGFVRSRPQGMLMALLLLGGYYAFFVFAYEAARSGLLPPLPTVWAPNALVFAIGVILLFYTVRRRP
jgi:lipopolysaccharide export system permease protein